MQVPTKSDTAGLLNRLVADELPSGSRLAAWDSFLRAHATLMRRLQVDLAQATGLALADFDVLAQLARAGGDLRMTEAFARLRAAEQLLAEGRRAEADDQLHESLAFWRSVRASRYVREGEALLAAVS